MELSVGACRALSRQDAVRPGVTRSKEKLHIATGLGGLSPVKERLTSPPAVARLGRILPIKSYRKMISFKNEDKPR
jgi:hypothetical protein